MNIAVLTGFTDNWVSWAEKTALMKAKYCNWHGYTFIMQRNGFPQDRHPTWGKIIFLQNYLRSFDWVFWTDADSIIVDQDQDLENFISNEHDLVIAEDGNGLNTGNFFIRNNPWSLDFLTNVYEHTVSLGETYEEQHAMVSVLKYSKHHKIVPLRLFNQHCHQYKKGEFIVHFAGLGNNRPEMMEQFIKSNNLIF